MLATNIQFSSVQFSRSVMSDSLRPHESQHTRPPCPSPTPRVHSDWRPLSWWCHPAISSSVIPFSYCLQSLPPSGSFPMSQLFAWRGQSTGVSASASVLPVNTQDWSPLGWTGWISLQSKGLSRVFSKHAVTGAIKTVLLLITSEDEVLRDTSDERYTSLVHSWSPLAGQWLGPGAFTVLSLGSVPSEETKILQVAWHSQKKEKGLCT